MGLKTACCLPTHWHVWESSTLLCSTMVHTPVMEMLQRPLSWAGKKVVCWTGL